MICPECSKPPFYHERELEFDIDVESSWQCRTIYFCYYCAYVETRLVDMEAVHHDGKKFHLEDEEE